MHGDNQRLRWYPSIKPKEGDYGRSLLANYSIGTLEGMRIISRMTQHKVYEYAVFDNHIKLFDYLTSRVKHDMIFHEVVLSGVLQKPRFDIDINVDQCEGNLLKEGNRIRDKLISRIISVLSEDNVKLDLSKDLLLYNSNRPEKYSSHIIIGGYYHSGCLAAKGFYEKVVDNDGELKKFVDGGIYSANHSLRMLWCSKESGSVPKIQEKTFIYEDVKYTHIPKFCNPKAGDKIVLLREFEESLIGFTSTCKGLYDYTPRKKEYDHDSITEEIYNEITEMLPGHCDYSSFELVGVDGSLISLKRVCPSMCPLCDRVHENRGAFVTIENRTAYWRCTGCTTYPNKIRLGEFKGLLPAKGYMNDIVQKYGTDDYENYESKLNELRGLYVEKSEEKEKEKEEEKEEEKEIITEMIEEFEIKNLRRRNTRPEVSEMKDVKIMEYNNNNRKRGRKRLKIAVDKNTEMKILTNEMKKYSQQKYK